MDTLHLSLFAVETMGTGRLNIWISEVRQPCKISNSTWWVALTDCDGEVLEWCGRRYAPLKAPCGHLEVELPPGTYKVFATGPVRFRQPYVYYNVFTDTAIVHICCDETRCVTLYPPTYHRCGFYLLLATEALLRNKLLPKEQANNLVEAITAVREHLPRPLQADEDIDFLRRLLDEIAELEKEEEKAKAA